MEASDANLMLFFWGGKHIFGIGFRIFSHLNVIESESLKKQFAHVCSKMEIGVHKVLAGQSNSLGLMSYQKSHTS